jgi:DNA-binding protein YbaB
MQHFIRRKNIENLMKQLASGRLDEAQYRYAQQRLAEELAQERAAADMVPVRLDGEGGGTEASC